MERVFIGLPVFEKGWKSIGLTDLERRALELEIMSNPSSGALLEGTGGIRKIRHPLPGTGKSGGIRVFYFDWPRISRTYLLAVIKKGEQENLTKSERIALGKLVNKIKEEVLLGEHHE